MNILILTLILISLHRFIFSREIYATIIRRVENEGFHRELNSLIEIVTSYSLRRDKCQMILEETMSSSFYVNPNELADLERSKKVKACSSNTIDIEKSQQDSTDHNVLVFSNLIQTENLLSAQVILPFHIRYHKPTFEGSYTQAQIEKPKLYIKCNSSFDNAEENIKYLPCEKCSSKQLCPWKSINFKTNAETLTVTIPVGALSHWIYISILTWLVTFGGCIYVMAGLLKWTRHFSNSFHKR